MMNILFRLLIVLLLLVPSHAAGDSFELDLDQCLRLVGENNLDIANARREIDKARVQVDIASGSRLPQLEFSSTYTRMGDEAASIPGIEIPDTEADLTLSASLPVYTGGLISASVKQAQIGLNMAREDYRATMGDLLLETQTNFFRLLSAQRQVRIAEEALDVSRSHERDIEALLRKGLVARVDLVRSQLDVSERERDLAAADTEALLASERLSSILFPEDVHTIKAAGDFQEPVDLGPIEEWHQKALELSPELRAASLSSEIARSGVRSARAEGRGTLSLFGAYGTSSDEFTLDEESRYWNAGVNYTLPLYSGGRLKSKVTYENQSLVQAENTLVLSRRAVREAVTIAWSSARLAVVQHATAAKAIASAQENLRVTTLKYQQGLVPNTDVIDAQLSLTRSRLLKVGSLTDFNIHYARLRRAAGTIGETP